MEKGTKNLIRVLGSGGNPYHKGPGPGGGQFTSGGSMGNGIYGNEGGATEKQINYAESLQRSSIELTYDKMGSMFVPSKERGILALDEFFEETGPAGTRRNWSIKDESRTKSTQAINIGERLFTAKIEWLREVVPSNMSKSGISAFIDRLQNGTGVRAFAGATGKSAIVDKVSLLNHLMGKEVMYVSTKSKGSAVARFLPDAVTWF